jgi:hypothetical protein
MAFHPYQGYQGNKGTQGYQESADLIKVIQPDRTGLLKTMKKTISG